VWLVLAYYLLIGGPEKDSFYVVTATPLQNSHRCPDRGLNARKKTRFGRLSGSILL